MKAARASNCKNTTLLPIGKSKTGKTKSYSLVGAGCKS
jgi:hypothetical protein